MRRVLLCVVLTVVGFGVVAAGSAQAAPRLNAAVATRYPANADPAEKQAVTGQLGYHENRDYPYGLIVFLVVMTPIALVAIRRWAPREVDA